MVARPDGETVAARPTWMRNLETWRAAVSGLALLAGWGMELFARPGPLTILLFAAATLVGGYATICRGLRAFSRFQFDMNVMMTGAVTGAALIGQWEEGAAVAFLYAVSNLLEATTLDRARRTIRGLMDLAPREGRIRREGQELVIPVEDVRVGDLLLVRPGEKIAADGIVQAGISTVDQSAITGESVPSDKTAGDRVYAGTVNGFGALEVEVTRRVADTTLHRIIHLVEEAQAQRAPLQQFVDRFARVYTPAVLGLAIALGLLPPLLFGQPWGPWIYRGLALLIVSCPCALVVSTPVSILSAVANAARQGVLIKGGTHLEALGRISTVALDKTGTVTTGRPEVTDVHPLDGTGPEALLALAAAVEIRSEHPLAGAIVRAAEKRHLPLHPASEFTAIPGHGARATVGTQVVYVGSPRLAKEVWPQNDRAAGVVARLEAQGKTAMIVGTEEGPLGVIGLEDVLRPESADAVRALRAAGVSHVALLSGDNAAVAGSIARAIGAGEVRAPLLPEDKLTAVRDLRERYGDLVMVGDGVNDAPALAAATVGVAMGVAGSDVALKTADVALMSDDLGKLPFVMGLGRATVRVIQQNTAFALAIKALAILAVFPGWLTLWLAVLGDMGASVLVTLNGMRLLAKRPAPHSGRGTRTPALGGADAR